MKAFFLSGRLAFADLIHERVMTLCVTLALASVMSPLLILYGLKSGAVASTREMLLRNPSNLEIIPIGIPSNLELNRDWFAGLRANPDTGFLIPQAQKLTTSSVILSLPDNNDRSKGESVNVDLWPTAEGDPLLDGHGGTAPVLAVPTDTECILSRKAAEQLKVSPGQKVAFKATRISQGTTESAELKLSVVGVLPPGAPTIGVALVSLRLVEDFEDFKNGWPVTSRGWDGDVEARVIHPAFSAVFLLESAVPPPDVLQTMMAGARFATHELLSPDSPKWPRNWKVPVGISLRVLRTTTNPANANNLRNLEDRLGNGLPPLVVPWNSPIPVQLCSGAGLICQGEVGTVPDTLEAARLVQLDEAARLLGVGDEASWQQPGDGFGSAVPKLLVSPAIIQQMGSRVKCCVARPAGEMSFPLDLVAYSALEPRTFMASASLSGILIQIAANKPVAYDEKLWRFLWTRSNHALFRLYAKTLEGVEPLKRLLEAQGLQVKTEPGRIAEAFALDHRLSLIFRLIGGVAVAGGLLSLLAGLVASVERKRYDLAVLKMVGFPRVQLALIPVWQGLLLTGTAFAVSGAVFLIFDRMSAAAFLSSDDLCRLSWREYWTAGTAAIILAIMVSLLAALRVIRIQPSEALRRD